MTGPIRPTYPNAALESEGEVDQALASLRFMGLREHPTRWKNWDLANFVNSIAHNVPKSEAILDVGCASNPLLWNLAMMGYSDLHGIDFKLDPGDPVHPSIHYVEGNLLATSYPDQRFGAITSLSVIEHGCDPRQYFSEMGRLLKPGGILLTSTDYWPRKKHTWFYPRSRTFGLPWTIFSREEIDALVDEATQHGFVPTGALHHGPPRPVVRWGGRKYTFFAFTLQRDGSR